MYKRKIQSKICLGSKKTFLIFFGSKFSLGGPPGASNVFSKNSAMGVFDIVLLELLI